MAIERVLVMALAAYWLSRSVTTGRGPWDAFRRLREQVAIRRGFTVRDGVWTKEVSLEGRVVKVSTDDDWLTAGVSCPFCATPWCVVVVAALETVAPVALLVLGAAGAATALHVVGSLREA